MCVCVVYVCVCVCVCFVGVQGCFGCERIACYSAQGYVHLCTEHVLQGGVVI